MTLEDDMDLAELIDDARDRGFTTNFAVKKDKLTCDEGRCTFTLPELKLVDSQSVDCGTDPGDEATLYLIETQRGDRGYLVLPYAPEADPDKTEFVDALLKKAG
jgi:hypothetical protein